MMSWTGLEEGTVDKTTPRCRHCGDPYARVDEHPDTRYAGLCPACTETAQEAEQRELIERNEEDAAARRAYYAD